MVPAALTGSPTPKTHEARAKNQRIKESQGMPTAKEVE
jgi:hypothetical protein